MFHLHLFRLFQKSPIQKFATKKKNNTSKLQKKSGHYITNPNNALLYYYFREIHQKYHKLASTYG